MIIGFLLFVFVVVCILLIVVILLQSSKGEGLAGSAFGGSGAQAIFGGQGAATFLSKLTTWLAVSFMVLSLLLAKFYGEERSVDLDRPAEQSASELITQDSESGDTVSTEQDADSDASDSGESAAETPDSGNTEPSPTTDGTGPAGE